MLMHHLVLLSGFYEAYLDSIIISFIQEKMENSRLTTDMKARLLFVILCGNLDLEPEVRAQDEEMLNSASIPDETQMEKWPDLPGNPGGVPRNPSSPWTHMENLVHGLRTYKDGTWCIKGDQ